MNLLLLSNSSSDAGYLVHALPDIRELIATLPAGAPAVFVPYAGVTRNWDDYTAMVVTALADTGLDIEPLHRAADPVAALERAAVIIVGGGNTFNLLGELRRRGLLSVVARRVREGAAYLGWSAGSNLACPKHLHHQRHADHRSRGLRRARPAVLPDQSALHQRPSSRPPRRDPRTAPG